MSMRGGSVVLMLSLFVGFFMADAAAQSPGIREVLASASPTNLIPVHTRVRVSTTIELPAHDTIDKVISGDPDFWVIETTDNLAHVKPAKPGAATDLKLLTKQGAKYIFWLAERKEGGHPDVWLRVGSDAPLVRQEAAVADEVGTASLVAELAEVRSALEAAEQRSTKAVEDLRREYPTRLRFAVGLPKYKKPFFIKSIWQDDRFTYIQSDATELPAIYELQDGAPAIVNFQVHERGTYVIPKLITRGYLALGKARFPFTIEERPR